MMIIIPLYLTPAGMDAPSWPSYQVIKLPSDPLFTTPGCLPAVLNNDSITGGSVLGVLGRQIPEEFPAKWWVTCCWRCSVSVEDDVGEFWVRREAGLDKLKDSWNSQTSGLFYLPNCRAWYLNLKNRGEITSFIVQYSSPTPATQTLP